MPPLYSIRTEDVYLLEREEIAAAISLLKQWRGALFAPTKIDKIKSINLINQAYKYLGWTETPVVFARGVRHAASIIEREFSSPNRANNLTYPINFDLYQRLLREVQEVTLGKKTDNNSDEYIKEHINLSTKYPGIDSILGREAELLQYSYDWLYLPLEYIMVDIIHEIIDLDLLFINNSLEQYFIEILNLNHEPEGWDILYNLTQECPYLIPLTRFCIVLDRPKEVYLNCEQLPHADDRAAIKFRDRTKVYFYHGIPIPAKYGKVPRPRWKPKWLLSERSPDYRNILTFTIGYKKFRKALPHFSYDFWQDRYELIDESINIIICWQLYHLKELYFKKCQNERICWNYEKAKEITRYLSISLPIELHCLYEFYNGGFQLCPGLQFYPLELSIDCLADSGWLRSPESGCPFPLFKGDRDEIYFINVSNKETNSACVYCQFPNRETIVYADCITSLIVTIGQCYREGAYELTINSEGRKDIGTNLSVIEPIFDKFNPDTIDSWRAIQAIDLLRESGRRRKFRIEDSRNEVKS